MTKIDVKYIESFFYLPYSVEVFCCNCELPLYRRWGFDDSADYLYCPLCSWAATDPMLVMPQSMWQPF